MAVCRRKADLTQMRKAKFEKLESLQELAKAGGKPEGHRLRQGGALVDLNNSRFTELNRKEILPCRDLQAQDVGEKNF